METRILDIDPLTGIKTTFRYDDATDQFKIGYSQSREQVEHLVDHAKRQAIESDAKLQMKNDMVKYATVPTIVQYEWLKKYGLNFYKREHFAACMALIDRGDYGYLKTTPIKHDFRQA